MNAEELKKIIASCVNDVVFVLNEKECGITSQVKNYIPTYQCWCGEKIKEYKNIDELFNDLFFDGQSLNDIIFYADMSIV